MKPQAFADTESAPAPDRFARAVAARRGEAAIAECRIGPLDGEDVAVSARYRGTDQMVFSLATSVPYRHRGIAQAMLAHWADASMADGCRSVMANDEIYRYQAHELSAETGGA